MVLAGTTLVGPEEAAPKGGGRQDVEVRRVVVDHEGRTLPTEIFLRRERRSVSDGAFLEAERQKNPRPTES
jgi:hypothetical protein